MLPCVNRDRPAAADRVETERLALRCWRPEDAPALIEAIAESLAELRAWMPWAASEPESIQAKAQRLHGYRQQFVQGADFNYGVFDRENETVLGSVGMHERIGAGAREIGYWIRTSRTGQGLASEAVGALCRVGFEILQLRRIEIHCHPANLASAAIPRKLHFAHAVTIANCVPNRTAGPRDTQIWAMTRDMYARSAAARTPITCIDAMGRSVRLAR